mmetsp:Transcript_11688/g.29596  ORF Transcript_11688/g.29596 Transcript_11688/m.29596 type:complete len:295 (-) Transcript_11688:2313-3197(-)
MSFLYSFVMTCARTARECGHLYKSWSNTRASECWAVKAVPSISTLILVISSMMLGLLQNHQHPYKCRFRNLLANTQASCWLALLKKVARNRTLGNRLQSLASKPASAKATTPSPALNSLGFTPRWAPILRARGRSRSSATLMSTSLKKSLVSSMTLGSSVPQSVPQESGLELLSFCGRFTKFAKAKGSFMASSFTPVFSTFSIVPRSSGRTKSCGVDAIKYSGFIVSHQSCKNCRAPCKVVSYPEALRAVSTASLFPASSGSTRHADRKLLEYSFFGLQCCVSVGSKGIFVMTA